MIWGVKIFLAHIKNQGICVGRWLKKNSFTKLRILFVKNPKFTLKMHVFFFFLSLLQKDHKIAKIRQKNKKNKNLNVYAIVRMGCNFKQ